MTMTSVHDDILAQLEAALEYGFTDRRLLVESMTHRSFLNEAGDPGVRDNERLEFFGDAVLGFFISRELLMRFPDRREGELTRLRAALVDEESLARFAAAMGLGRYLRLGRGEERSGGREKRSILANAAEALLAALYLDGGSAPVERLLASYFTPLLDAAAGEAAVTDYKTELQEMTQARYGTTPRYELEGVEGPDHERRFAVAVAVGAERLGEGTGRSKKEAEQAAARMAVGRLLADSAEEKS